MLIINFIDGIKVDFPCLDKGQLYRLTMNLPMDLIDCISEFCTIGVFISVNTHSQHLCKNRAASLITNSIRKWIDKKHNPCHQTIEIEDTQFVCLQMVRANFNEFNRPDVKILLAKEFTGLRFDTAVNLLGNELNDGDGFEIYNEKLCYKVMEYIIKDCFDNIEFDMEYIDSMLTVIDPDYKSIEDGGLDGTVYIDDVIIAFTRAIYTVCYTVSRWNCLDICDAIERITGNAHHMVMIDM